jgi:hypothetical protein
MQASITIALFGLVVFLVGFVIGHHEGLKLGESLGKVEAKIDDLADRVDSAKRQREKE